MTNTAWAEFYKDVVPFLPGVGLPQIDHTLMSVARDFCEETHIWRAFGTPADVSAGMADYVLGPPAALAAAGILADVVLPKLVWVDGVQVNPLNDEALATLGTEWETLQGERPFGYIVPEPGTLRFVPIPTRTFPNGLRTRLVLQPAEDATGVPDWIYSSFRGAIAQGVIAALSPSEEGALGAQKAYSMAVGRAKIQSVQGFTGASPRVRIPRYGR